MSVLTANRLYMIDSSEWLNGDDCVKLWRMRKTRRSLRVWKGEPCRIGADHHRPGIVHWARSLRGRADWAVDAPKQSAGTGLVIMKLLRLRDHQEYPCLLCHHG